MESVADRIKRLRLARGLTQQELVMEIGAAVQSISRWESGVTPIKLYRRALAAALGVSVAELMTGQLAGQLSTPAGHERRVPALQPLREVVSRIQTLGEDVLVDFVDHVAQMAQQDYLRGRRR